MSMVFNSMDGRIYFALEEQSYIEGKMTGVLEYRQSG